MSNTTQNPGPADEPVVSPADLAAICGTIIETVVPVDRDLFTYGLTSLALVRLIGAIAASFGTRLGAVDIHDHPTCIQLSTLINSLRESRLDSQHDSRRAQLQPDGRVSQGSRD